jgi:cell division protein FtsB
MVGINWYIIFKKRIEFLEDKNRKLLIKNSFLERRMKKLENNNTRTTRNRKDNNVVKFG